MPQSLTNFDNALKDDYSPGLRNAINNSNPVFTEVQENTEDIIGRKAVWSLHSSRSASTGARGELASLPTADRQRYQQLEDTLAYLYHTVKVSGPARHLTRGDEGAFARALESELDGAEKDLKNDVARQVFGQVVTISGTDYTGVLGKITAVSSNTYTLGDVSSSEMRYFFSGQKLDVINGSTAADRSTGEVVQSVDRSAQTVTVDAASGQVDDYLTREGNLGEEINGLRFLISDTQTYASVDPTSVDSWASQTVGGSSTGISEVLLDEATEAVETDGDGSSPSVYIFEHVQRRKLASVLQAQKRFDGRQTTLTAGWRGLQVARGTLVVDRYCPTTTGWALTPSEIERFVGLDWTFDEDDGKVLFKALDGSDAVEARFKTYMNLEATTRNAHTKITVSEPSF